MATAHPIINKVRIAVATGVLKEPFQVADVYKACGGPHGTWSSFLAKHRDGNPSGDVVYFMRIARGLYRLVPAKSEVE